MLNILQSIILGIIQGLTEWFPISSSGHLALYQNVFKIDAPILYDVYLHIGTLIVVSLFFWKDIMGIIKDFFRFDFTTKNGMLGLYVIIGSFVTGLLGIIFHGFFSATYSSLTYIGIGFLVNGTMLFVSKFAKERRNKLNWIDAIIIGVFQASSLASSISRSGATISAGLFRGVNKIEIARYSFLLSIPAVIGASIIESFGYFGDAIPFLKENFIAVIFGIISAVIAGYLTLGGLMMIIQKGGFHKFSWYCFAIGIITLIISFI